MSPLELTPLPAAPAITDDALAAGTFSHHQITAAIGSNRALAEFVNPLLDSGKTLAEQMRSALERSSVEPTPAQAPVGEAPSPTARLRREVLREQLIPFARRGAPAKVAAEALGIPYSSALSIYNDESFRREVLAPMREAFGDVDKRYLDSRVDLVTRFESGANRAFEVLMEVLDDPLAPKSVRVSAAREVLDRNKGTQAGRTDTSRQLSVNVRIDAAALAAAAQGAREMDAIINTTQVPQTEVP